jgi:hypothetical protein
VLGLSQIKRLSAECLSHIQFRIGCNLVDKMRAICPMSIKIIDVLRLINPTPAAIGINRSQTAVPYINSCVDDCHPNRLLTANLRIRIIWNCSMKLVRIPKDFEIVEKFLRPIRFSKNGLSVRCQALSNIQPYRLLSPQSSESSKSNTTGFDSSSREVSKGGSSVVRSVRITKRMNVSFAIAIGSTCGLLGFCCLER